MKMRTLTLVLALAFVTAWGACTQGGSGTNLSQKSSKQETEKESAKQDQSAPKATDFDRQKDEFLKKAQDQLAQNDKQMDQLRNQAKTATNRKRIDRALAQLEPKRRAAQKRLDELKSSSGAAWEDLKVGVNAAVNDLSAAFNRIAADYQKK